MMRRELTLRIAIAAILAAGAALAVFYFRELAQTLLMLFAAAGRPARVVVGRHGPVAPAGDGWRDRRVPTLVATVGNVVVLFVSFYLAWNPDLYRTVLLRPFPEGAPRRRAGEVTSRVVHALRSWMVGRLASMAVVG